MMMAETSGLKYLAASLATLALSSWPAAALAQSSSSQTADNTGLDFFRPPPNLFQLLYGYRTAPGSSRDVTTDTLNFRYDHAFYLTPAWILVTRSDLPLLAKNTINSSNPNGNYRGCRYSGRRHS